MYVFNHYHFKSGRLPPSPDHIELGKFTPRPPHIQSDNWAFADFVWEGVGGSGQESDEGPYESLHFSPDIFNIIGINGTPNT